MNTSEWVGGQAGHYDLASLAGIGIYREEREQVPQPLVGSIPIACDS
jgi:hypothetical protein